MAYTYKQLSNPSTNLIALLEVMNADGVQDALYKGSEPFEVLAAKAITNAYGAIDDNNIQALLDSISSTQGAVLFRGASAWSALAPGTSGQALTTGGAGANPSWTTLASVLPSQTGNNGYILTTNGASASWTTNAVQTSITGPSATNLTLAGGSSGASLVLGQGTNGMATIPRLSSGNIYSSLVVGTDLAANTGTGRAKITVGTTAADSEILLGQGASNSMVLSWNYNATAASATGSIGTYGYSNPINVNASVLRLQTLSGGNITVGTTATVTSFAGTTASTSTTTGALIVSGGVGVAGAGYFGSSINATIATLQADRGSFSRALLIYDTTGNNNTQGIEFSNSTLGTSSSSAYIRAIRTSSSGSNTDLSFGTMLSGVVSEVVKFSSNGVVNLTGTASASSSTVGALTVGNGSAATNVAIGGGSVWAGDTVRGGTTTNYSDLTSAGVRVVNSTDSSAVKRGIRIEGPMSNGSTLPALDWYGVGLQEMARIYPTRTAGSFATTLNFQTAQAGGTLTTGITIDASQNVAVTGNLTVSGTQNVLGLPASASALGTNSTMTFELTSNTSLTIKVRGTDGTTRSVALTLA